MTTTDDSQTTGTPLPPPPQPPVLSPTGQRMLAEAEQLHQLALEMAVELVKAAAVDLSGATSWADVAATHVTDAELRRRRAEPGPLARDPEYRGGPVPWTADDEGDDG